MDLQINGLKQYYNGKLVLNIENFFIPRNTFIGIIGPNGAGKSTLVKIIAKIEEASSGEVLYNSSTFSTSLLKNMTLVFQKPYLLRTTVYNNIAYPLELRKIDKNLIHKRVLDIMEEMEIVDLKNQKAWTLSGGEAQKVALARGLIFQPSLLILDEFTANIDPASMIILERNIQKYHATHSPTIIMVTHNLQQAKRLCSHVAFMNNGEIIESGDMEAVIFNSNNLATRRFISGEIIL